MSSLEPIYLLLHYFPIAAVTNYHNCSVLKAIQINFLSDQKSKMRLMGLKSRCQQNEKEGNPAIHHNMDGP